MQVKMSYDLRTIYDTTQRRSHLTGNDRILLADVHTRSFQRSSLFIVSKLLIQFVGFLFNLHSTKNVVPVNVQDWSRNENRRSQSVAVVSRIIVATMFARRRLL